MLYFSRTDHGKVATFWFNGASWNIPVHDDPDRATSKLGFCPEVRQGFDGCWNSYPFTSVLNYMKRHFPGMELEPPRRTS